MKTAPQKSRDSQLAAFAAHLKAIRLQQGRSLHRVAKTLAINKEQLTALEAWDETHLPQTAYQVGLLNSYAELLGVDPLRPRQQHITPLIFGSAASGPRVISRWAVGGFGIVIGVLLLGYVTWLSRSLIAKPRLEVRIPYVSTGQAEKVTLAGSTDRQTIVRIDGQPVTISDDGSFSGEVYLRHGHNVVTITAINSLGRQSTVVRDMYR